MTIGTDRGTCVPFPGTITISDRARATLIASACLLLIGCAPRSSTDGITPNGAAIGSAQYMTLTGVDTLGLALVTRCSTRVIGDDAWKVQGAHIHTELSVSNGGYVESANLAIWRAPNQVDGPPTETVTGDMNGDTLHMEAISGPYRQRRSIVLERGSQVFARNNMALLIALFDRLQHQPAGQWQTLSHLDHQGATGRARLLEEGGGTMTMQIDSSRFSVLVDAYGPLTMSLDRSPYRIVRLKLRQADERIASQRCLSAKPPSLQRRIRI